jgi:ubiquinone/menaquinone biosynthesis C-methylase UbiE
MNVCDFSKEQGHWVLAKMGKRVLRPGGKELTHKMISGLNIKTTDHIVEFAPGLGYTAGIALKLNPANYTGIELDEKVAENLRTKITGMNRSIINANAANTPLDAASTDKVYGEAMLTMHADHRKAEIIREAHRILKPGGLYGIHEIVLSPDDIPDDHKAKIQREMAEVIRVNARPLTQTEWTNLLKNEGFEISIIEQNPMHLLKTSRMIDDEGFIRTLKIGFNILKNSAARKRIMSMRKVFNRYENQMRSIAIVAKKI